MGWNTIYNLQSELFNNIQRTTATSTMCTAILRRIVQYTIAKCNYGVEYAAAIQKDNFYGVQFHTEKSAEIGDKIIKNFLELSESGDHKQFSCSSDYH